MCLCEKKYPKAQKRILGLFLVLDLSGELRKKIEAGIGRLRRPPKYLLAKPAV